MHKEYVQLGVSLRKILYITNIQVVFFLLLLLIITIFS